MKRSTAWISGFSIIILMALFIFGGVVLFPKRHILPFANIHLFRSSELPVSGGEWALVSRVVDGDTIELEGSGKVRYIGINAPESVDPRRKVECFGKEASLYNKNLVEGKRVRLEKDISNRDKYGRLLRFVYLEDGTFVNEALVREGYAYASPYTPDISKKDFFREGESIARMHARGLWSPDTCDGKK
jgi:micrococcal nuclease